MQHLIDEARRALHEARWSRDDLVDFLVDKAAYAGSLGAVGDIVEIIIDDIESGLLPSPPHAFKPGAVKAAAKWGKGSELKKLVRDVHKLAK